MAENARIVVKIGGNALGPDDTTFQDLVAVQKAGHSGPSSSTAEAR